MFDLPEIINENIVKEFRMQSIILQEYINQIKKQTKNEEQYLKQLTSNLDQLALHLQNKVAWTNYM